MLSVGCGHAADGGAGVGRCCRRAGYRSPAGRSSVTAGRSWSGRWPRSSCSRAVSRRGAPSGRERRCGLPGRSLWRQGRPRAAAGSLATPSAGWVRTGCSTRRAASFSTHAGPSAHFSARTSRTEAPRTEAALQRLASRGKPIPQRREHGSSRNALPATHGCGRVAPADDPRREREAPQLPLADPRARLQRSPHPVRGHDLRER